VTGDSSSLRTTQGLSGGIDLALVRGGAQGHGVLLVHRHGRDGSRSFGIRLLARRMRMTRSIIARVHNRHTSRENSFDTASWLLFCTCLDVTPTHQNARRSSSRRQRGPRRTGRPADGAMGDRHWSGRDCACGAVHGGDARQDSRMGRWGTVIGVLPTAEEPVHGRPESHGMDGDVAPHPRSQRRCDEPCCRTPTPLGRGGEEQRA
jgi:hypothetical protein